MPRPPFSEIKPEGMHSKQNMQLIQSTDPNSDPYLEFQRLLRFPISDEVLGEFTGLTEEALQETIQVYIFRMPLNALSLLEFC